MTATILAPTTDNLTTAQRNAAILLENIEWLLMFGTCWPEVCQRLNRTHGALSRYLYRHGRPDLGRSIDRAYGVHYAHNDDEDI